MYIVKVTFDLFRRGMFYPYLYDSCFQSNQLSSLLRMSFEDFCTQFTTVTICMLVNTSMFTIHKTYNEGVYKGSWEGRNAGGCVNYKDTFLHNPQVGFKGHHLMYLLSFADTAYLNKRKNDSPA